MLRSNENSIKWKQLLGRKGVHKFNRKIKRILVTEY
jgi:hypothetical protein